MPRTTHNEPGHYIEFVTHATLQLPCKICLQRMVGLDYYKLSLAFFLRLLNGTVYILGKAVFTVQLQTGSLHFDVVLSNLNKCQCTLDCGDWRVETLVN